MLDDPNRKIIEPPRRKSKPWLTLGAMPETINKFAAEKDKRTSVQGLRGLILQNQKRQSAIPSWVKPAPQVI